MNILSLFDGISCGNYVLNKLGFRIDKYYSSEIDKYAIKISKKHYPNQIRLGDVRKWRGWSINWSSIDLILVGSPCQSFSIAGKQKGFEGASGLIEYFFDILEHIKSLNPNVKFLLENVYMKEIWKNKISQRLSVNPVALDSSFFSAQSRKRLYWCNFFIDTSKLKINSKTIKDILEDNAIAYLTKAHCLTTHNNLSFKDSLEKKQRAFVAKPIRVADINKGGQGQRIYSIQGKSVTLTSNGSKGGGQTGIYKINLPDGDYIFRKLTPIECERLQGLPDNYTEGVSNNQRYKVLGNAWQCDTISFLLKQIHNNFGLFAYF